MLEHFRLTFDYANKQVYAEPRRRESLRERLAAGLKVGDRDLLGYTPLHLAAKADVNARTNAGESALRIARARRFQNIVAILEKAGAKD
jgi:ankyrin repeat protein